MEGKQRYARNMVVLERPGKSIIIHVSPGCMSDVRDLTWINDVEVYDTTRLAGDESNAQD